MALLTCIRCTLVRSQNPPGNVQCYQGFQSALSVQNYRILVGMEYFEIRIWIEDSSSCIRREYCYFETVNPNELYRKYICNMEPRKKKP